MTRRQAVLVGGALALSLASAAVLWHARPDRRRHESLADLAAGAEAAGYRIVPAGQHLAQGFYVCPPGDTRTRAELDTLPIHPGWPGWGGTVKVLPNLLPDWGIAPNPPPPYASPACLILGEPGAVADLVAACSPP